MFLINKKLLLLTGIPVLGRRLSATSLCNKKEDYL
jgi:hypothetical protein